VKLISEGILPRENIAGQAALAIAARPVCPYE
jgi:hypothetical protein